MESVREPRRLTFISPSLRDNLMRILALCGFLIPPLHPFHVAARQRVNLTSFISVLSINFQVLLLLLLLLLCGHASILRSTRFHSRYQRVCAKWQIRAQRQSSSLFLTTKEAADGLDGPLSSDSVLKHNLRSSLVDGAAHILTSATLMAVVVGRAEGGICGERQSYV